MKTRLPSLSPTSEHWSQGRMTLAKAIRTLLSIELLMDLLLKVEIFAMAMALEGSQQKEADLTMRI